MTPIRHLLPSNTFSPHLLSLGQYRPKSCKSPQFTDRLGLYLAALVEEQWVGGGALTTLSRSSTEEKAMTQQPTRVLGDHPTPVGAHTAMGMPS